MKLKTAAFVFLIVLLALYLFLKNKSTPDAVSTSNTVTSDSTKAAQAISESTEATTTLSSSDTVSASTSVETNNDPDSFLKAKGFVEDPENPDQLIKKTLGPSGKPVTFYVQKNSAIEPNNISEKTAREALESKRDLDPQFEFENMKIFDDKNLNDSLLSGSFRNEELDLEFRILMTYQTAHDSLLDSVRICFSAPKLNLEIPTGTKVDLRTDGSGYGIAKLKDDLFLRLAWSMDPKRKIHAQIIRNTSGQSEKILDFESPQANSMEKNNLKRCLPKAQL